MCYNVFIIIQENSPALNILEEVTEEINIYGKDRMEIRKAK